MRNESIEGEGIQSGSPAKHNALFTAFLIAWLGCASPVAPRREVQEMNQVNWTSADAPCAHYDNIRKPTLGNIGIRIDATGPWAEGFRQALVFWNSVLAANFHEEANLNACTVRIVDGGPEIVSKVIVARSQLTERDNFLGKIAVSPAAAKAMSSAELYAAAVHEFGHMLGLKHNANIHSVMYFLDLDGTEGLDSKDVSDLRAHHQLRPAAISAGFLPIQSVQPERASEASLNSGRVVQTLVRVPPPAQTGGFQ